MDYFVAILAVVNGVVWGPLMLALILGTGVYLLVGCRAYPWRFIPRAFRLLLSRQSSGAGQISPFNALMTSLSATIGTGNIAGVATALFFGGPGALFWMWCTALVGMATKYAEAVLAVKYRQVDAEGNYSGGPMYYIRNGLGPRWRWLAVCFALFGGFAGFGIGDGVQANAVAAALEHSFAVPRWLTALALLLLVGMVILGGVQRIARVAGILVPLMATAYLLAGLIIIVLRIEQLPTALLTVVDAALTGSAVEGGLIGSAVLLALRWGVARGIFSNEAGLGSAPIAHAAAKTDDPVRQGSIAMLGTFIDTLVICSITGLAILLSGAMTAEPGLNGSELTAAAFSAVIPGGDVIVSLGLMLFAFSTLLGWSYYSERCWVYLFGTAVILPFRLCWLAMIPVGALLELKIIWDIADTLNALMAIPNLIALLLLSPVVFSLTREAIKRSRQPQS